jgi:hypothetical protein
MINAMTLLRFAGTLAALLILMLPSTKQAVADPSLQPDVDWDLVRDEDGIRSYLGVIPGAPLLAFKGEATLDRDLVTVMGVLLDSDRVGEWIARIKDSKVVDWVADPYEYLQYTRFDAPWPVTDRIFLTRVRLEVDSETLRAVIYYLSGDDSNMADYGISEKGAIRGSAAGSYYIVEPVPGRNQTRLTAVSIADPKGSIPGWLINWVGTSLSHNSMVRLRNHLKRSDLADLPMVTRLFPRSAVAPHISAAPGDDD